MDPFASIPRVRREIAVGEGLLRIADEVWDLHDLTAARRDEIKARFEALEPTWRATEPRPSEGIFDLNFSDGAFPDLSLDGIYDSAKAQAWEEEIGAGRARKKHAIWRSLKERPLSAYALSVERYDRWRTLFYSFDGEATAALVKVIEAAIANPDAAVTRHTIDIIDTGDSTDAISVDLMMYECLIKAIHES